MQIRITYKMAFFLDKIDYCDYEERLSYEENRKSILCDKLFLNFILQLLKFEIIFI